MSLLAYKGKAWKIVMKVYRALKLIKVKILSAHIILDVRIALARWNPRPFAFAFMTRDDVTTLAN